MVSSDFFSTDSFSALSFSCLFICSSCTSLFFSPAEGNVIMNNPRKTKHRGELQILQAEIRQGQMDVLSPHFPKTLFVSQTYKIKSKLLAMLFSIPSCSSFSLLDTKFNESDHVLASFSFSLLLLLCTEFRYIYHLFLYIQFCNRSAIILHICKLNKLKKSCPIE